MVETAEEMTLTINDPALNGNGVHAEEPYTPTLEERSREFRTGKRVIELPGGGVAVVRLPSAQEIDTSETMMSIALFKLKKEGVPFLAQLAEHLDDTVDRVKLDAIIHDDKMNFMEKAQAFENLLSDSFAMGLVNHTAEARAQVTKWNYLLERCVEDEQGKNFWEVSGFQAFERYPSNAIARHITNEWYKFYGEAQNPLFSSGSPVTATTGISAGESVDLSTVDLADPGTLASVN